MTTNITHKLDALVQLVQRLGEANDTEAIFEPALDALAAVGGAERTSIILLDAGGVARFVAWRGISERYRRAVEGHFPWAADDPSPQPILVPDIRADVELAPVRAAVEDEGIRAVAFIPLIHNQRLVGKFMLYHDEPRQFSDDELEFARTVAYLVAFAIQRTRLSTALAEADRRKDAFLATLAHELRNPLAPASTALDLMAARPDDQATAARAREILTRSIRHIVKLVDDLLDVSRITRGVIELQPEPVELTAAIRDAIAPAHALIASKRQHLTLALEPLWIEADPVRFEQIITNLVHNAAKYTPAGGHIAVAATARGDGVEIRVEDDGIGVPPALLPRIFEVFAQADRSLARSTGGLGIGLTIVRELVRLHAGTISVASEGEGRGSTFTVWLPRRIAAPRAEPVAAPAHAPAGPHHHVLVVDDNKDAASTLALLLESLGHDVAIANDGPSALAEVGAHHPDLVLLDLGLPGMTGFEVAEQLRARYDGTLRIVAVSGYGQPEDLARSHAAGCDAHLVKPVDRPTLERLLA